MPDDSSITALGGTSIRDPGALLHYIEDMLLELAQLAAGVDEAALAASLAIAAIQAGAARRRYR